MNKSRWTVALAFGTVGAGLLLGAVAFFATSKVAAQPARPKDAPAPAIGWIPEATGLVGFVDLRSLAASPLKELWSPEAKSKDAALGGAVRDEGALGAVDQLRETTGIDLWKDVDQLTFSFAVPSPPPPSGTSSAVPSAPRQAWGMVVSGRFDAKRLAGKLSEREGAAKRESYGDIPLYAIEGAGDRGQEMAVALASDSLLLFGSPEYLHEMIDCGKGGKPSAAGIVESWGYGDFGGDSLWVAGKPQGTVDSMLGAVSGGPALRSFSLSGRLDTDLTLTARGRAADAESAEKLADVLRGLLALGRLRQSESPQLAELADAVRIDLAGEEIHVGLRVPYDTIRDLIEKRRTAIDR